MQVTIAKVDEVFYEGEAYSLTVPASGGEMTVLHGHMPLVTTLKAGIIAVKETADMPEPREFKVPPGGVLEVRHDGATVIL